ncbi:M23 family metallopeptidase [Aliikangiella maris]|uniref:M23 family metallopeptidase n=2 Tax=Aliikangiella maris TaxID=3162458 RepID=A0ABV3MVG4_9GAMM
MMLLINQLTERSLLHWPTNNSVVTSNWGPRTLNGKPDFHKGVDIRAANGEPIYSVSGGKVISTKGYGNINQVFIRDDAGGVHGYANVGATVSVGDSVYPGQIIATSDGSGTSAAHLHYSYKPDGVNRVNPLNTVFKGMDYEFKN